MEFAHILNYNRASFSSPSSLYLSQLRLVCPIALSAFISHVFNYPPYTNSSQSIFPSPVLLSSILPSTPTHSHISHTYKYEKLGYAYEKEHVVFVFLSSCSLMKYNVLQFHQFSFPCHNLIFLYGWIKFDLSMCHIFFPHSFVDGHLNWLHFLAIANNEAINMDVEKDSESFVYSQE